VTRRARVTFLGTGTSHGVPMIGCACSVCTSSDPRDRRWRPSIYLELPDLAVLVDTSTDLRAQALHFRVPRVDAILFTHGHADHVMGLDEVRRYNALQGGSIPCYADADTVADLRRTFAYIFDSTRRAGGGVPRVQLFTLCGAFCLGSTEVVPVPLLHGRRSIYGYRVGTFAYLTDCSSIPDGSWHLLAGVDLLVLDALRHRPHPTHLTVEQAVRIAERIGPSRAYFTHIAHDLPHAGTCALLPGGVELAYDGLIVEFAV
jgi:phosphoribosyl 1,2-cyclic phosphate phosphodiesterase